MAKSSDGNWYRATILSATDTECKVQFPDYGNSETVAKESLKKLDPQFYEPCALALVAGLGLVALTDDALTKFKEWTEEKELQVTLSFGSDGWLANLHLDGVDLTVKLVNEKLATPQVATEETEATEAPTAEPVSLPEGCQQVYVSHIDSPGQFWLQMSDKIDAIEEIQAELQANASTYADLENREIGVLCVAKFTADELWYRAEILDADSDITTVRFIDYGNTDVLDNQPGVLKVIPDKLKETEGYAVKASVNAVPTGTGQWSEPASDYFVELCGDLSNPVDALVVLKDVTTYIDIFVNGKNLTDKLVSEGHATRSDEPECGGNLPTCFASHVNSPSEFWIQLESATDELQAVETAMVDAANFPELTEKEEGVICAAQYPEDGFWYRAQVIVDGSEGTEVLFMDYGNASIATELRNLPEELKNKPALSRKCALQKPRDIKSWSRKSEEKFNELAAEGATIFNVQFIASGDISIVELYLEGKSVTEELVGLCEEQPLSERPTPVGQDLKSSGKICYTNSVDEFYVNLDSAASNLGVVMEKMLDCAEFEKATDLKVGTVCAAFWAEDEQWYRAKILESCDVGYHVLFIDYGNKAKCEDFRVLPEDIALIEPLAKCCRLATSDGNSISDAAKKRFEAIAADGSTFLIEFLDTTKEPVLVRLTLDGEDVSNIINNVYSDTAVATEEVKPVETEKVVESEETVDDKKEIEEKSIAVAENEVEQKTIAETEKEPETIAETINAAESHTESIEETKEAVEHTENSTAKPETTIENAKDLKKTIEPEVLNNTDTITNEVVVPTNAPESEERTSATETGETETDSPRELDSSLNDLNESLESNHTVIENKSFEANAESLDEDFKEAESHSPEKDSSAETLENSNDTIKTPERDDSKESINTDTGYTSDHEKSPATDATTLDGEQSPEKQTSELKTPERVEKLEVKPSTV